MGWKGESGIGLGIEKMVGRLKYNDRYKHSVGFRSNSLPVHSKH